MPDLHVLMEIYGGYASIPPEAWEQHERELEQWRLSHGMGFTTKFYYTPNWRFARGYRSSSREGVVDWR